MKSHIRLFSQQNNRSTSLVRQKQHQPPWYHIVAYFHSSFSSSSASYVWNILFFMYCFRWSTPNSRTTPLSVSTFPFHITFTSLSVCLVAEKMKPKFLNVVFDNFSTSKQGIFFLEIWGFWRWDLLDLLCFAYVK